MNFWLMKSEPGCFGIDDLKQRPKQTEPWDGVRNYPDHTAFDPREKHYDPKSNPEKPIWFLVDVKFVKKFKRVISLQELREEPMLRDMLILRPGSRLSITPLAVREWETILSME